MKTLADLQGLRDSMAPPRPRRHPDRRVSLAPAPTPGPSETRLAPAQTLQPSETRLAPIVEPEPEPEWTPPLTVLPAVRRKPVGPAATRTLAPPRTPRSSAGARGTGAIDFIAMLKERYPKGTLAHACFGRALGVYAASPRDAAAAQALSQEVGNLFVEEPGLVEAFQSFFEPGVDPNRMSLDSPTITSPSLLDVLAAAPPPLGARINGKGETIVRLKAPRVVTPTDKYDLVGREVRKPYSEWCYSEWHFGTVSHMSKPGHYVIAWDERTGPIEYAASKVIKFLSPDSRETEDEVGHRKHATFPVGARVEAWWAPVEGRGGDWYDAVITYAGDVYEVEWVDDPGVFNRASHEAVRAKGSAPAAEPQNAFAMLGFNAPASGSGRAAAQEAARRIASHDFQ